MATVTPNWLDAGYLENILRNAEGNDTIEISDLTVKTALNEGDNYGSNLYRVTVEFSWVQSGVKLREKRSLILKAVPYGDLREEWILSSRMFDTELSFFSTTLPKMRELFEGLFPTSLGARCLHVNYEKPIHLIVDDLVTKGFRMAERELGLDLDHCLLAVQNLGRFHATSVALKEKEPAALGNYMKGRYPMDQSLSYRKPFGMAVAFLAQAVTSWTELDPRIGEKLVKLSEVAYEKGYEASLYIEDDFNVLNHGDFWVNNMMFRYNDQDKPIDHIFVDFQRCCQGSPAVDILYFFGSSPSYEVRFHNRELLLREYYSSLTDTMNKLRCATEAPSFDELQEILKRRAFCEALASMTALMIVTTEKGKSFELEKFLKPQENHDNTSYYSETFKKIMRRLLPFFDRMGLLDV